MIIFISIYYLQHILISYQIYLLHNRIHIMAGKVNGPTTAQNDATYLSNLKMAATILEKNNLLGVIEPINQYSVPGYYLSCYEKGKLFRRVASVGRFLKL